MDSIAVKVFDGGNYHCQVIENSKKAKLRLKI